MKMEDKIKMNRMTYGYVRVSSENQVLDRQIKALIDYGVPSENIIREKESGKKFNDRPVYNSLLGLDGSVARLRKFDTLVVKELDRLGRNKEQIKEQLKILRDMGVRVKVLDIPTTLMDLPEGSEWVINMVTNILIEVLGTIAEQERIKINTRQREGIDAMPVGDDGVKFSTKDGRGKYGRPKLKVPEEFAKYYEMTREGILTNSEAMKILGIKRSTFYKYAKAYKESINIDSSIQF